MFTQFPEEGNIHLMLEPKPPASGYMTQVQKGQTELNTECKAECKEAEYKAEYKGTEHKAEYQGAEYKCAEYKAEWKGTGPGQVSQQHWDLYQAFCYITRWIHLLKVFIWRMNGQPTGLGKAFSFFLMEISTAISTPENSAQPWVARFFTIRIWKN